MTIYPRFVSGISRYYNQCFVLNKEDLQRIHSVLDSAAARLGIPAVVPIFRVEREDDRFYETDSIDQVFSDPNIEKSRIVGLSLELCYIEAPARLHAQERQWIVYVQFLREKKTQLNDSNANPAGVKLQIAVENKDWALLLADELEPQVKRTFKAKYTPRWLLWSLLIPVALFVIKLVYSNGLLNDFWPASPDLGIILAILVLVLVILLQILNSNLKISGPPAWFTRWFGPESGFLWGDELQEYSNREQTRQNIMWGIVVAFWVSVVAGGIWLIF